MDRTDNVISFPNTNPTNAEEATIDTNSNDTKPTVTNPSTTEAGTPTGTEVSTPDGATVAPSLPARLTIAPALVKLAGGINVPVDPTDEKAMKKAITATTKAISEQTAAGKNAQVARTAASLVRGALYRAVLPPSAKGRSKAVKDGQITSKTEARKKIAADNGTHYDDVKRDIRAADWFDYAIAQGLTVTEFDDKGNVISTRSGVPVFERLDDILNRPPRHVSKYLKETYGVVKPEPEGKADSDCGDSDGTDEARIEALAKAEAEKARQATAKRIDRAYAEACKRVDALEAEGAASSLDDLIDYIKAAKLRIPIDAVPDVAEVVEAKAEEATNAPPKQPSEIEIEDLLGDSVDHLDPEGIGSKAPTDDSATVDPKLAKVLDGPKGKDKGRKSKADPAK